MRVSFIVITYQRGELLQSCIDSILAQDGLPDRCELIVIDNDGSADIHLPDEINSFDLHIERSAENLGVAGGRNRGMEIATGDILVFLDDDAIFNDSTTASKMIETLIQHPGCGAVAGRSVMPSGELLVRQLPYPNKDYALTLDKLSPAPYFYGVVHALRSEAIKSTGMYPARYFYAMEELDLSLRIVDAGYTILYHPDVVVTHYHSPLGRDVVGDRYWIQQSVNRIQVAWRLLPYPYPLTNLFIWIAAATWRTRKLTVPFQIIRRLAGVWPQLRAERAPINRDTVSYLQQVGARLLY